MSDSKIPETNQVSVDLQNALHGKASPDEVRRIVKADTKNIVLSTPNKCGDLPLHRAPEALRVQDRFGNLPLHTALEFKASYDVLSMLLQAYPKAVEVKGESGCLPLHIALRKKLSSDVVKMILQAYPKALGELNEFGKSPLHVALEVMASDDVLSMLLQAYPKAVEVQDNRGFLPLHIALRKKYSSDVLIMLFEVYPKAVQVPNKYKELPLHIALDQESPNIVIKMLLDAYPKAAEVHSFDGTFPLHIALQKKASNEVVKMLYEVYPKVVEVPDKDGYLPLHIALRGNYSSNVVKMISKSYPKSVGVHNSLEDSPFNIALQKSCSSKAVKILEEGEGLQDLEGSTITKVRPTSVVKLVYYFLTKFDSLSDPDIFFHSVSEKLSQIQFSGPYFSQLKNELVNIEGQEAEWTKLDQRTLGAKVKFVIGAMLNTCVERNALNKCIEMQNELIKKLQLSEPGHKDLLEMEASSGRLDSLHTCPSLELLITYKILKEVLSRNDSRSSLENPDAYFSSLKQQLIEIKFTDSFTSTLRNDLIIPKQHIDWTTWEENEFKSKIEFVVRSMLKTCNERLFMQEKIELQNMLVKVLSTGSDATIGRDDTIIGTGEKHDLTNQQRFPQEAADGSGNADIIEDQNHSGNEKKEWTLQETIEDIFLQNYIIIRNMTNYTIIVRLKYTSPRRQTWKCRFGPIQFCPVNFTVDSGDTEDRSPFDDRYEPINPDEVKHFDILPESDGAVANFFNSEDSRQLWGKNVFIHEKTTYTIRSNPTNEKSICIKNNTAHYLCVIIHGQNRDRRSTVEPKQAEKCTRKLFSIEGDSVEVTIKKVPNLCCGWDDRSLINKGGTLVVAGLPVITFDDCRCNYFGQAIFAGNNDPTAG
jgi:ankyrin repeat protein